MKVFIVSSVLFTVLLIVGCSRSQEGEETGGANNPATIQVGATARESEDSGYLGLKILKASEHQILLDKAPWHEPGGDWIFLECAVEKDPDALFIIGARARTSPKGEVPISWGEAFLAINDSAAAGRFVDNFAKAFHRASPSRYGDKPPGFLKMNTAILGSGLVRSSNGGGFAVGKKGTWISTKWFLESDIAEAEVYFNYNLATGQAEFCEKDEDYREELIEQLVVGLRDGPLPERTPENDPALTLDGPRIVGWTQIAGSNEVAQFMSHDSSLLITTITPDQGTQLFIAPTANPEVRKHIGDFEGSVQVHDFLVGEQGPTLFLTETLRKDPHSYSSADPQSLWLVNLQGKHQVNVPNSITNWFAGKGSISPDGRFLALQLWLKQSKQQNTRIIQLGDLQKHTWQAIEQAETSLEFMGWLNGKGVVLTGDAFGKDQVRKAYALAAESGQLSPLESIPAQFKADVVLSPSQGRAAEVQEKKALIICDLATGQKREFTVYPSDRRNLYRESLRWINEHYLVFQGSRTALINADTLKMNFPTTKESGFSSVEFSPDFKWALGRKSGAQFLGKVEIAERSGVAK